MDIISLDPSCLPSFRLNDIGMKRI
jgi:hypothetical protein